ncbi:MAG TPA: hypothetical protein VHE35_04815 [Kofleriaceae bacterium]|nr:hypothetical protein [Kofleriaceae bacterium]
MTWVLIKLAIRIVVFLAVFWLATARNEHIVVRPKWTIPLVAGFFAILNTALYWLLKPVLNVASFHAIWFLMPLVLNLMFLVATARVFQPHDIGAPGPLRTANEPAVKEPRWKRPSLHIDGIMAFLYLAVLLTVAHGVLWFGIDYLPTL